MSPAQLANLKPASKGEVRNPRGFISKDGDNPFRCDAAFRHFLKREIANEKDPKVRESRLNWILKRLFSSAMAGDNRATEILLERAYGMPDRKIDIGASGGNITFNVITGVVEPVNGPLPDVIDVTPTKPVQALPDQSTGFEP